MYPLYSLGLWDAVITIPHEEFNSLTANDNWGVGLKFENIYDYCEKLEKKGVTILRPPRDGKMAFIRSPDQISIELLQQGDPLPIQEPWSSMKNRGKW